jgi:hypothetical protein
MWFDDCMVIGLVNIEQVNSAFGREETEDGDCR